MIKLLAETPKDQKTIDNLQRSLDQFKKHMENRIKELREEFEEYKNEMFHAYLDNLEKRNGGEMAGSVL